MTEPTDAAAIDGSVPGLRWLACGEDEHPSHLDWLTAYELSRLDQMRFPKRRHEYLLRRWTGKRAVAALLGLERSELVRVDVRNRWTGAPHVHLDDQPLGMDISLTDRAGWAVCLVAAEGQAARVGVDLELVEPRSPGFVRDFLTGLEQRYVRTLPDDDARHAAANLIWSAKESALKVRQTGLRADTRSVEIEFAPGPDRDDGWHVLSATTEGRRLPGWWRRDGVFLLTVVQDGLAAPPEVLSDSADLAHAVPVHSWLAHPAPLEL